MLDAFGLACLATLCVATHRPDLSDMEWSSIFSHGRCAGRGRLISAALAFSWDFGVVADSSTAHSTRSICQDVNLTGIPTSASTGQLGDVIFPRKGGQRKSCAP